MSLRNVKVKSLNILDKLPHLYHLDIRGTSWNKDDIEKLTSLRVLKIDKLQQNDNRMLKKLLLLTDFYIEGDITEIEAFIEGKTVLTTFEV